VALSIRRRGRRWRRRRRSAGRTARLWHQRPGRPWRPQGLRGPRAADWWVPPWSGLWAAWATRSVVQAAVGNAERCPRRVWAAWGRAGSSPGRPCPPSAAAPSIALPGAGAGDRSCRPPGRRSAVHSRPRRRRWPVVDVGRGGSLAAKNGPPRRRRWRSELSAAGTPRRRGAAVPGVGAGAGHVGRRDASTAESGRPRRRRWPVVAVGRGAPRRRRTALPGVIAGRGGPPLRGPGAGRLPRPRGARRRDAVRRRPPSEVGRRGRAGLSARGG
jgi:hypothetical protein